MPGAGSSIVVLPFFSCLSNSFSILLARAEGERSGENSDAHDTATCVTAVRIEEETKQSTIIIATFFFSREICSSSTPWTMTTICGERLR